MAKGRIPDTALMSFSCGHQYVYSKPYPETGERAYCAKCMAWRVATSGPVSYRIRCRDCVLSRQFASAKLMATHAASAHVRRRPTHTVDVLLGDKVVDTAQPKLVTIELPDDLPPY